MTNNQGKTDRRQFIGDGVRIVVRWVFAGWGECWPCEKAAMRDWSGKSILISALLAATAKHIACWTNRP